MSFVSQVSGVIQDEVFEKYLTEEASKHFIYALRESGSVDMFQDFERAQLFDKLSNIAKWARAWLNVN